MSVASVPAASLVPLAVLRNPLDAALDFPVWGGVLLPWSMVQLAHSLVEV